MGLCPDGVVREYELRPVVRELPSEAKETSLPPPAFLTFRLGLWGEGPTIITDCVALSITEEMGYF